jgi:hypothetical protein
MVVTPKSIYFQLDWTLETFQKSDWKWNRIQTFEPRKVIPQMCHDWRNLFLNVKFGLGLQRQVRNCARACRLQNMKKQHFFLLIILREQSWQLSIIIITQRRYFLQKLKFSLIYIWNPLFTFPVNHKSVFLFEFLGNFSHNFKTIISEKTLFVFMQFYWHRNLSYFCQFHLKLCFQSLERYLENLSIDTRHKKH